MPTPSAAAATPGLAFAAAEPPPQAPLPGPCWRSRGARPTCAPLTQQTPPRRPSDPPRGVGGVSSGHANARGGAGRRGTRPPPHVHGPCRCHCRCVPARWSTEHFPNNNCAACKCRSGTSKAAAPMRLSIPERSCGRVRTARRPWKRGGSALFLAENDRLVSCRYCCMMVLFRAKKQQVSEFCPIFPEQNWALAHNKQCARYKTYIVLASRCPGGTYATITLYEQHLLHTQCLKTLIFLSC